MMIFLLLILWFSQINWTYETIDSLDYPADGGIGYASLQLDSVDAAHLVYYQLVWDSLYNDTGWAKIIYANNISDQWTKETVDSSFGNGWTNYYIYPSICLDKYDRPHIVYVHRTEENISYLRYACKISGNWLIQTLDTIPFSLSPSAHYGDIVVDTNEYPHIVCTYKTNNDTIFRIKHFHWNGTAWESSIVNDGNEYHDGGPSVDIDIQNLPHIAYYQGGDVPDSIKYAYWNGVSWIWAWAEEISMGSEHGSLQLILNVFSEPCITYCAWPALHYAYRDSSTWQNEGPVDAASWEIRLELDSLRLPHVVYIDQMDQRPEYCYRDSSASWHLCGFIEPDSEAFVYRSLSFDMDRECNPHVVYIANKNNQLVMKYVVGNFTGLVEKKKSDYIFELEYELFPNPTKRNMIMNINSRVECNVSIEMYDVAGRMTATIFEGTVRIGKNEFVIQPLGFPAGVYFISVEASDWRRIQKVVILN